MTTKEDWKAAEAVMSETNQREMARAALQAAKTVIEMMERPVDLGDEVRAALDRRVAKIDQALAILSQPRAGESVGKWAINRSTNSPILTYEKCSVIQDEQAFYVLSLIRAADTRVVEPDFAQSIADVIKQVEKQK